MSTQDDTLANANARGVYLLEPDGWASDGDAFTVAGVTRAKPTAAPTVSSLTPATAKATDAPLEVHLVGTGFVHGDRVSFGGATPLTSFHSDTDLSVRVNPGAWSPGTLNVGVAYSTRGPSNAVPFTIT